jgi:hypothetical protein
MTNARMLRHAGPVLACAALLLAAAAARADDAKPATVVSVDAAKHQVTLSVDTLYSVTGDTTAAKLGTLAPGDHVTFMPGANQTVDATTIQDANVVVAVPVSTKLTAFGIAAVALLLVASWFAGWNPLGYFIGKDKRVSNSQTQLVLWSATVLTVYLATVLLRIWYGGAAAAMIGGVEIPQNLLALSGLSGLSFAGARAVTTSKDAAAKTTNAANAVAIAANTAVAVPEKKADPNGPAFSDLFQDDHDNVDLGDAQMILITFIAVALYLAKSLAFLSNIEITSHVLMPDVDTYLLASFGIGQGAYLAKKAASNAGQG